MNKYIAILFALVATLFTANALAFTPPPAPAKGWYVVDQTGRLTDAQIKNLNQKIERISKATKNEFGIALLQDMGGDNIEDAANATFKAWGIGKRGLDNGCLIMVALKERKTRIETGKGVEGEIPDLKASDILEHNLKPRLKAGDFYGGFDSTLDALSSYLESRQGQKADPPPAPVPAPSPVSAAPSTHTNNGGCDVGSGASSGLGIVMLFAAIGVIGLLWARAYSRRKAQEEEERQARMARDRARRERIERENQERLERLRSFNTPTPVVPVPTFVTNVDKFKASDFVPPPVHGGPPTYPTRPAVPRPNLKSPLPPPPAEPSPTAAMSGLAAAAAAGAALAAAEATATRLKREREEEAAAERRAEARHRREREEREAEERRAEERRARAQREEEERQAEQRRQEESSRSSYSYSSYSSDSSSSSYDSGSSSSDSGSSGSDSGGGFGGGDSGGGGASSDF